ncbi:MAG TPA: M23 family metallopeptidase [Sandaracinaceae bacterium LLY-WYZ-13_1]|nr:M23 family metallopeptidase [Sandaracinaceae bacterium LLY-WYZ-13_1]
MARPTDSFVANAVPVLAVPLAFLLTLASAGIARLTGASPDRPPPASVTSRTAGPPAATSGPTLEGPVARREPRAGASEGASARRGGSIRWRRMRSMRCFRHDGRRYCDGPLRAPEPRGPAAERAARLRLDDERRVGPQALHEPPEPAWLAAVEGEGGHGLLWPVPRGRMARGYGEQPVLVPREDGRGVRPSEATRQHPGVDIAAPAGSEIRAVDDGLVLFAHHSIRGYGNSAIVLHPDASVTLYAHCSALRVFAGQRVRRGQVIAEVGDTGLAHGEHLHFEWRRDGETRNPAPHFVDVPSGPADDAERDGR